MHGSASFGAVVHRMGLQLQLDNELDVVVVDTKVREDEPNPLAFVAPKQRTAAQKNAHQRQDEQTPVEALGRKFIVVCCLISSLCVDGV